MKRLARHALPLAPAEVRDWLALTHFMEALEDEFIEYAVKQSKPKTVDEAVKAAVEIKAFWLSRRRRLAKKDTIRMQRLDPPTKPSSGPSNQWFSFKFLCCFQMPNHKCFTYGEDFWSRPELHAHVSRQPSHLRRDAMRVVSVHLSLERPLPLALYPRQTAPSGSPGPTLHVEASLLLGHPLASRKPTKDLCPPGARGCCRQIKAAETLCSNHRGTGPSLSGMAGLATATPP